MKKNVIYLILLFTVCCVRGQASYIAEQLGRDAHHIVQSLGAFVGNESAERQQFDITYMPAGNRVEGVMIINTADYRCTFKMDPKDYTRRSQCGFFARIQQTVPSLSYRKS